MIANILLRDREKNAKTFRCGLVRSQDIQGRLLLAPDGTGCEAIRTKMQQVSTPCTISAATSGTSVFGSVTMAVHEMGDGHSPYQKIGECEVVDFIWDHIICRFGLPKEIDCDNGPKFVGSKVTKVLEELMIKRIASYPYYPSANGHDESTNKVIIQNIKNKLEDAKGKRLDELPCLLWAYRTTTKSSTGETPFLLVYESEALIPVEVGEPTLRFSQANEEENK
uniref:Integrase catalytic domain-containing protein n=1 Tax=Nicotiana tabacum TaxID=4097 RepID=A0A1S4C614_TOBAC|nr:PREDICTED: uncharacterized protein LOC107815553 [Nicotiana tabacum]